jgi:hypothetical protein
MYEGSTNPFVLPASTTSSGIDSVWPSNLNILSPPRVNLALCCDSSGPRGELISSRQHGNSMREKTTPVASHPQAIGMIEVVDWKWMEWLNLCEHTL